MSNSYRIRTKPGVDSSIKVLIDQEFEYLEILSLKILKSQIYTRPCSDYGVIVGRVSINNGFGLPNAKVSVFIPLDSVDEDNPVISDIYPYKTLTDLNEDGYRYNLLPYERQHGGHTPTGTFFTREDVLTNPTLIEVYDKYYKYTAVTNDSGDYMIFGVPIGAQTIVADIDLSDIGEFSLSPQDLIRMGVAAPNQVAGTKFKSSTNLRELPQIFNINRTLEVEPLWGEPEICNLGITRADFDLSSEAGINITPTAVFMGSLISSSEDNYLKRSCKPKPNSGNLCELVTGPGEILAIRQTIQQDTYGRPLLEQFALDEGGQVIDENGTWLVDLPMNLDYVVTNEFGEQVISDDPKVGIPTKGRYRFKIKWNQSPSLSAESVKRGYFLVPNIKEYGWEIDNGDRKDPKSTTNYNNYSAWHASYAFSVDWDDYGANNGATPPVITPMGAQMISEAINCEDRFYEFQYNKVYTVSQLMTQYRKGYANARIIAVKDILDSECESENNKFPTNDGMLQFDIIYLLFTIMMFILTPIMYVVLLTLHILSIIAYIIYIVVVAVVAVIFSVVVIICEAINFIWKIITLGFGPSIQCPSFKDLGELISKLDFILTLFTNIQIPVLSYPDCEFCQCDLGEQVAVPGGDELGLSNSASFISETGALSVLTPFEVYGNYTLTNPTYQTNNKSYEQIFAGNGKGDPNSSSNPAVISTRVPDVKLIQNSGSGNLNDPSATTVLSNSLTVSERLNLFNTKAKYFDTTVGGGVNQIKVGFNHVDNPSEFHYDNVIAIIIKPGSAQTFEAGNLITFQNPTFSTDPNITGYTSGNVFGTNSITGTSVNNDNTNLNINYIKPDGTIGSATYLSKQGPQEDLYAKFPMDIEYFQVITGLTMSDYITNVGNTLPNSLPSRFILNYMNFYKIDRFELGLVKFGIGTNLGPILKPVDYYSDFLTQKIIFLVRGVDPNSTRSDCQYDLSKLFGYNGWNQIVVKSGVAGAPKYKLNIPIQGDTSKYTFNVRHDVFNSNATGVDSYSGLKLYYESYRFQPEMNQTNAGFTGFTSNLVSYYSNLDNNNTLGLVSGLPNNGLKVESSPNLNSFVGEVTSPNATTIGPVFTFTTNNLTNNRGYLPGEIVEGGSAFYGSVIPPNTVQNRISVTSNSTPVPESNTYTLEYKANRYPTTVTLQFLTNNLGINNRQIVMRSDRLPTSTSTDDNVTNTFSRSFPLHTNLNFTAYYVTDDGGTIPASGTASGAPSLTGTTADNSDNSDEPGVVKSVIDSFTCGQMVPLRCYTSSGNQLSVKPQTDSCYYAAGGGKVFKNGSCYVFVSTPFISIFDDFELLKEWSSRLLITFGACRNVFGHFFSNNWINGTLYAFSFRNDVFFTSPFAENPNQATYNYCKDVITLHNPTYNFYYRSSPYWYQTNEFIGATAPSPAISLFGPFGGNKYNLNFPTTIMDLGPRTNYIQELVMSDDYDGYIVNKLLKTTYSDVSELLNLFIITRLANTNFLQSLINTNILSYFDKRNNFMIDGDYAQAISVTSELGVSPFESANYPDNPPNNPIYINTLSQPDQVFGVFFSSDTKTRDFVSPKRTIINPNASITDPCAFSNFRVFTQKVPFYQWNDKENNSVDSIFGSQANDWYSDPISGNAFFSHRYQLMDRTDILGGGSSRYFRTNNQNQGEYFKGYIYNVDNNGVITGQLNPFWSPNSNVARAITVGAPFHFYFGLKRGKTAFDRFASKWIDTNIVVL